MVVITKTYELVLEITERVREFPRDLRFALGDRVRPVRGGAGARGCRSSMGDPSFHSG
jgi:hypothetical protein